MKKDKTGSTKLFVCIHGSSHFYAWVNLNSNAPCCNLIFFLILCGSRIFPNFPRVQNCSVIDAQLSVLAIHGKINDLVKAEIRPLSIITDQPYHLFTDKSTAKLNAPENIMIFKYDLFCCHVYIYVTNLFNKSLAWGFNFRWRKTQTKCNFMI